MAEEVVGGEESRDSIYTRYHGIPPAEEKKEEKKEEVPAAPAEAKQPEVPAEEPKAEEKKEEVKEVKKEERKLVPYDALHEERVKRKAAAEAARLAEERQKQLEAEIARLKKAEPSAEVEEEITDYDRELKTTRKDLREANTRIQAIERLELERIESEKQRAVKDAREAFEATMEKIDRELEADGYPGFKYVKGHVANEIKHMIEMDETGTFVDGEEHWKQAFKERVFPQVETAFAEAAKKRAIDTKKEIKTQANLNTIPGKAPVSEKKADVDKMTPDQMREHYMKVRRGEA